MNLRGHRPSHEVARSSFADRCRGRHSLPAAMSGLVAVAILAVSGCKTGGTGSPLAWWPGSSKGSADNEKLASAPSFDGKVEKPSETQRPYPTTTTPQSYAIDGQKPPSLASTATTTAPPASAGGNSPDAYGTRGPVAASSQAAPSTPATPGGVAAQVGPYQGWPAGGGPTATAPPSPPPAPAGLTATPSSPATPATAGSSAALGFGSASSMTPDALEPPARYADSRFGEAAAAAPSFSAASSSSSSSATASEPEPSSRYSTSGASQFGSQPFAAAAPPPSPSAAPPQAALGVGDPSAVPPQTGVNRLRAPNGSAGPSTPPARRPDPGYRPGGTSTYRPSQAIVGEPADDGPVRQASFQSPLR